MKNKILSNFILLTLLCLLFSYQTLAAAEGLKEFKAVYILKRGSLKIGETHRTFTKNDEGHYLFETKTFPTGLAAMFVKDRITENSIIDYKDNVIRPLSYLYERTGGKKERIVKLKFDWKKETVTNVINDDPWKMTIEPGTLDKLIYQIAVMQGLKTGQQKFNFQIADGGKIKHYEIGIVGEERASTPMGKFNAVKVVRLNKQKPLALWLAPELDYLPVRIEYTGRKGHKYKALLKSTDLKKD